VLDALGAEVFARPTSSMYLWSAFPGVPDSLTLAADLMPKKVIMAPGRVFSVDPTAVSPWSRCNVGAIGSPRFKETLEAALAQR